MLSRGSIAQKMMKKRKRADGYSLVELLVATVLFTIVAGTVFSLLLSAQLRYKGESDLTASFQQANVAIDQITRDVHSTGYPPADAFVAGTNPQLIAVPFAWSAGYPSIQCTLYGSCGSVPGDNDLILEFDANDGNGTQWIRYSLDGTTLKRAVVPKTLGDPVTATSGAALVPYLENVVNGAKPIFSYYDNNGVPAVHPSDIREVKILLIVQSAEPDPQTHQIRNATLTGQAIRINPNE